MRPTLPPRPATAVPPSAARLPRALVVAAVPIAAAVILAGVWVTGGLLTDDETVARRFTGAWFAVAGALAVLAALRWRQLAAPLLVTWFLTSGVAGGFLLLTSSIDRVVDEQVTVATDLPPTPAGEPSATP